MAQAQAQNVATAEAPESAGQSNADERVNLDADPLLGQ